MLLILFGHMVTQYGQKVFQQAGFPVGNEFVGRQGVDHLPGRLGFCRRQQRLGWLLLGQPDNPDKTAISPFGFSFEPRSGVKRVVSV